MAGVASLILWPPLYSRLMQKAWLPCLLLPH